MADTEVRRTLTESRERHFLNSLIEKARNYEMTPEEMLEQKFSFVYGEMCWDNPDFDPNIIRKMLGLKLFTEEEKNARMAKMKSE